MSDKLKMTVIFTDHSATTSIAKQTHLTTTTNTDKLNLRLVCTSQNLSQFDLDIQHWSGWIHLVFDALLRLLTSMKTIKTEKDDKKILNNIKEMNIEAFHLTLIEMVPDFRERLQKAYQMNVQWKWILDQLLKNHSDKCVSGLQFIKWNSLIYYINNNLHERLCVPQALKKKIFKQAHDHNHHGGFHRTYNWITAFLYIRHLARRLKVYIAHCSDCQVNQIRHHPLYSSLQSISMPSILFHIIAMNFILALSQMQDSYWYDSILFIIDKFTKWVLLLPERSDYTVAEWANIFLSGVTEHDWGISHQIISDWDLKFLLSFWQAIFEKLKTKLLTSSAYHSQTDNQSEHTNQTVKIALQYHVTSHSDKDFTFALPYIQETLNNSWNAFISYAQNELAYGFWTNDSLTCLADLPLKDYTQLQMIYCEKVKWAITFAQTNIKHYYDVRHEPITLNDYVYICLHHRYSISGVLNHKLSNQRVNPFWIIQWIDKLAYELELPFTM